MKLLYERYKDASLSVRSRAPNTFVVLSAVALLLPVVIISDLISGRMVNALLALVIELFVFVSIFFLVKGFSRVASLIPVVLSTVALVALSFLIRPESVYQIYTVTVYMVPPLVLTLVISEHENFTITVTIIGILTIVLASLLIIAPVVEGVTDQNVIGPMIRSVVMYGIAAFFAIRASRAYRITMQDAESAGKKNIETLGRIAGILDTVESGKNAVLLVEEDYQKVLYSAGEIDNETREVSKGLVTLRERMLSALKAVKNTVDQAKGFDAQVEEQNAVVHESTASVNQMSASLDSVAGITSGKKQSSERLAGIAAEGLEELKVTNREFENVANEMNSLLEINKLISNIAAQTNLLSMNAAIEAAHAGDAGRGFAVVADEIRKLASTAAANSRTIAESLRKLVKTMADTGAHARKSTGSMTEIVQEIHNVTLAFDEISGSTAELSTGGREIMEAMQSLQSISVKVRDGSRMIHDEQQNAEGELTQVGELAVGIEEAFQRVESAIGSIRTSMNLLHEAISRNSEEHGRLVESISRLTRLVEQEENPQL